MLVSGASSGLGDLRTYPEWLLLWLRVKTTGQQSLKEFVVLLITVPRAVGFWCAGVVGLLLKGWSKAVGFPCGTTKAALPSVLCAKCSSFYPSPLGKVTKGVGCERPQA